MKLAPGIIIPLLVTMAIGGIGQSQSIAQIAGAIDGSNTLVNQRDNTFNITGGTQVGANLFHSFQRFGLNQGQIANFLSNISIQNILGRVTGGEASVINGLIQITGGTSNLYLMNPAGIIFGPNASLNVSGSFLATTASGIGFDRSIPGSAGGWFNAGGTNEYTNLGGSPTSLAFSALQPAAIVNSANLAVNQGKNLALLGGTVTSTGQLSAPDGLVTVASVPGQSLIRIGAAGQILSIEIRPAAAPLSPTDGGQPTVSLAELLTGGKGENATGLTVNPDGTVTLTGSEMQVQNGDVAVKAVTAKTATLSATNNLTLVESQLQTTGNLRLLAQNKVQVRDSGANPVVVRAGTNLQVQGNQGIDILALNHPEAALQSGGNLSLISNGVISGDGHFAAGGHFSILNLAGQTANFISLYDPIISSLGDVTLGDYTGASLKVEARGSIRTGNITINNTDGTFAGAPPGSDREILATRPALILRAGVATLQEAAFAANPPNTPSFTEPGSGTLFTFSTPTSTPMGSGVTVGTSGNIASISASYVDISAPGDLLVKGPINGGGRVRLTSNAGNVTVHSISTAFNGTDSGDIDIAAAGLFRATGVISNFYADRMDNYAKANPDLIAFLVAKTGDTAANIIAAIESSNPFLVQVSVPSPTSIRTYLGNIRIRYTNAASPPITASPGVTLQGGNAPFVIGPRVVSTGTDAYRPAQPTDNFSTFVANPFSLVKNETYAPITIPDGASGTVGAINRTISVDGSLTNSLQNRVFGILPQPIVEPQPQPAPPSTQTQTLVSTSSRIPGTEAQVIQRPLETQMNLCGSSGNSAVASGNESSNRAVSGIAAASGNPCASAGNDAQILKILGESPDQP
ncbi:MAG: filamentous hemagglutinin N-terminal domain-containing protein [Kovacikia sp.]